MFDTMHTPVQDPSQDWKTIARIPDTQAWDWRYVADGANGKSMAAFTKAHLERMLKRSSGYKFKLWRSCCNDWWDAIRFNQIFKRYLASRRITCPSEAMVRNVWTTWLRSWNCIVERWCLEMEPSEIQSKRSIHKKWRLYPLLRFFWMLSWCSKLNLIFNFHRWQAMWQKSAPVMHAAIDS